LCVLGGASSISFWPMLEIPRAGASEIGPTVDSATCSGIDGGGVSRPNCRAMVRIASAPLCRPSSTKAVLQDLANASRRDTVAPPPQAAPP